MLSHELAPVKSVVQGEVGEVSWPATANKSLRGLRILKTIQAGWANVEGPDGPGKMTQVRTFLRRRVS